MKSLYQKLKNLLLGKNQLFKITTVEFSNIDLFNNAIEQIYNDEIQGLIIKDVLNKDELKTVKQRLANLDEKVIAKYGAFIDEGFLLPKAFPVVVNERRNNPAYNLEEYFMNTEHLFNDSQNYLGVNLFKRTLEVLNRVTISQVEKSKHTTFGNFTTGTIRAFSPPGGNVSVHCGNYFQSEFPEFYGQLEGEVVVKDQLSYTLKLQDAEAGGQLTLYDLLWNDTQTKESVAANDKLFDHGNPVWLDSKSLKKTTIDYKEGDMLIFNGGKIWHRVEGVQGQRTRVTIGGFIGVSKTSEGYKCWA